ncbi:MAG: hypothetical protein HRU20_26965 [Pseudomonadales bacterium]|nr:hypothetical protein [Pseudomonadales bacterium]
MLALSEFHQGETIPMVDTVKQYNQHTVIPFFKTESHGLTGAAATAMESRMSNFAKAANRYQQALEKIRLAYKAKAPRTEIFQLEKNAKLLHSDMNMKFQAKLNRYMGINQARGRGTVWSSSQRGINLAKSARTAQPIKLSSTTSFTAIKGFEKASNVTGKGIILFDAGLRVNNVYDDYKAGADWQRRAAMETTGFGLGAAAGAWVGGSVVSGLLGVAMFATPVGWVLAIGIGLAAGYFAAKAGDETGKFLSSFIYDKSHRLSTF